MICRKSVSYIAAFALLGSTCPQNLSAQSPITAFSAAYQSRLSLINLYLALPVGLGAFGSCNTTNYTYTYSVGASNLYKLNSFNANGSTYLIAPASPAVVKLRRVNNPVVTGTRNIVYMETTAATAAACPSLLSLSFKPPYVDSMEILLAGGNLNQGTDNVFTNASNGDGNNNNIERVDVIFTGGLNTSFPTEAGFAIFDRGANYQHDPFKIAAITSLDASGNPNGFGAVKTCTGGNGSNNGNYGHPSDANGNRTISAYVLRKDSTDTYLRASSNVNQEIGGVFYSFSDLGIAANQPLYGYALLGPDGLANPTSAQMLDLTNSSVYPTNTTEAVGGGLDLVAVNSVFATGGYVVLPLTVTSFTGSVQNGQTSLAWQIAGTEGGETVALERSTDNLNFQPIYTMTGTNSSSSSLDGSWTDTKLPDARILYYRLQISSGTGKMAYSTILAFHDSNTLAADWHIYPTIAEKGQLLSLRGLPDGSYTLSFFDTGGACHQLQATVSNGAAQIGLPAGDPSSGIYYINISSAGKRIPGNGKIFIR